MRFNANILKKETSLFECVSQEYRCKYSISKLYLDNTYCDPIFQFPNRVTKFIHSVGSRQAHQIHYRPRNIQFECSEWENQFQ